MSGTDRGKSMIYLQLLQVFFLIGCFSFGGGLAGMELSFER